jgi:uncharacterized protein (DUF1778 family)
MAAEAPRETLNIRIKPELRGLIDRAAGLLGKTRTDFVLEASRLAAEEALLDRTLFTLREDDFRAFVALLDAPPAENQRLRKLMQSTPPWDAA